MKQAALGRLEKVELRDIWLSEAVDFTSWLARAENLKVLGNTIGVDLELEAQEKHVGTFWADILCKDSDNGNWVLIENQLERTDHNHLGQLLTYAAGLQAVTIVWVAAQFTEEHRASLDWLNEITDDRFQFFGLEIELWRIADSPEAPKFNIISKPNDWSQSVTQSAKRLSDEPLSELQETQRRYWSALKAYLKERGSSVRSQKPLPQHWTTYGIGRSNFHLSSTINTRENRLGVELFINGNDAKSYFHLLEQQKEAIEADIGSALEWMKLPDRKGSRIVLFKENDDPTDEDSWPGQHAWFAETLARFDRTFRSRVRALDPENWTSEEKAVAE